jgi:hypothetical protein
MRHCAPDNTRLLAENPHISSTVELRVAATEAQFPPKVKANHDAPRAGAGENVNSNNSNFSWKINDQSEVNSSCSGGRADKNVLTLAGCRGNFMPV